MLTYCMVYEVAFRSPMRGRSNVHGITVLTIMVIAGVVQSSIVVAAGTANGTIVAAVIAGIFLIVNTVTMVLLTAWVTRKNTEVERQARGGKRVRARRRKRR